MRRASLAPLALLLALVGARGLPPASADIAPDPEYGTTLAPWGPCGVRMADEHVTLRLEKDRVLVKALFTLVNGDQQAQLRVGFPDVVTPSQWSSDVNDPPQGGLPKLQEFRALVDGAEVKTAPRYYQQKVGPLERTDLATSFRAKEAALEKAATPEEKKRLEDELAKARETYGYWQSSGWMVWEMAFAPKQERKVEVTYRTQYRGSNRPTLLGSGGFQYILKTGAFWDGPIGRALVDLEFGEGLTPANLARTSPDGWVKTERGLRWDWKDLEPTFDIELEVKTYADLAAAAAGYRAQAEAAEKAGETQQAAWAFGCAYTALAQQEQWKQAAQAARDVLRLERVLTDGQGPASPKHPRTRLDWRGPFVPFEARLLEALDKAGLADEARQAAAEVRPALEAWLPLSEKGGWGAPDAGAVKQALERVKALLGEPAGSPR